MLIRPLEVRSFVQRLFFVVLISGTCACAAHKPTQDEIALNRLTQVLREQPHECVPLGWAPVTVISRTYYPGYTSGHSTYEEWLDAIWRGAVHDRDLSHRDVRAVFDVLNALVAHGLMTRERARNGYEYHLTMAAVPYFYGGDNFDDNHGNLPYLCYSTVVPTRIAWGQRIHSEINEYAMIRQPVFRVAFDWTSSAPAEWANDRVIREHSVVLPPVFSPALAKLSYRFGDWHVPNIFSNDMNLPRVVDPAVW
jgi:hypothetical protein